MKLYIAASLLILLSGCATQPTPYDIALSNFTYVADVENEFRVYESIDTPFEGDCEDFAFTLQKQIGGKVWYTFVGNQAHAVLVADNTVYDYLYGPTPVEEYPNNLIYWFTSTGEYGTK